MYLTISQKAGARIEFNSFTIPQTSPTLWNLIAVVEVDTETGLTQIKRFVAVDDVGNVINPMIVRDKFMVAHSRNWSGPARGCNHDESGQLSTGTYLDYVPEQMICQVMKSSKMLLHAHTIP